MIYICEFHFVNSNLKFKIKIRIKMPKTLNFQLESIFVEGEEDHELEENRVELETHKKKRGRPRKDCEVEEVHDVEEIRIEEKKESGRPLRYLKL